MSDRRGAFPGSELARIIDSMKREGHQTREQHDAAQLLLAYMAVSQGNSRGLVGSLGDRVDDKRYGAGHPIAFDAQMGALLERLHQHERAMLRDLAIGQTLEGYSARRCGYQPNRTLRAFGTGRLSALLDSVAEAAHLRPVPT